MESSLFSLLACPSCRSKLSIQEHFLQCSDCHREYLIKDSVPFFVAEHSLNIVHSHISRELPKNPLPSENSFSPHRNWIFREFPNKSLVKKIAKCFVPPHHSVYFQTLTNSHEEGRELKDFLEKNPNLSLILNVGSLSMDLKSLHPKIINLDIIHYPNIDIVADAHELPFRDEIVDMILFKNVLEHVRNPSQVLSEIFRVLKKGGFLYIKVPFLQPYHAVPDDYQRYTVSGFKELMKPYEELEFGISVGPGSSLSWILREYLAIATSLGNQKFYYLGLHFWGWLTFWIKYTDIFFRSNRLADRLASAWYGFYRKP